MNRKFLTAFLLLALPAFSQTGSQWVLLKSSLTYHVTHPMHQIDGVSHAAKGKGTCHAGICDFLIAAPVNTFDTGDSNRDLHMLQVTRGAQFPMIIVRTRRPEAAIPSGAIYADLEVQFAGQTVTYKHVALEKKTNGNEVEITGTIPLKCTDFKLDPPSFLTVPIKNEIPVRVDMTWQRM
jgi:hypothetical protein